MGRGKEYLARFLGLSPAALSAKVVTVWFGQLCLGIKIYGLD